MARSTIEAWLPEEKDSQPIQILNQTSAVEALARPVTMKSNVRTVPRAGEVDVEVVPKGTAYGEDDAEVDEVTITARKFGKIVRLAEEDIDDSLVDVLTQKKTSWATSYAKMLDNACLAVTAAENGTTIPFTSVYKAVRTADVGQGYTADDNYLQAGTAFGTVTFTDTGDVVTFATPHGLAVGDQVVFGTITSTTGITAGTVYYVRTVPSTTTVTLSATLNGATLALTTDGSAASAIAGYGQPTYENLSDFIGLYEASPYFDESRAIIIAHPSFKKKIRKIRNDNGDPVFSPSPRQGDPDTLFGYPIRWSLGAKTHATATPNPTGNPIMVMVNRDLLILGRRSGPESVVIDGRSGASATTDETLLKMRARRGFKLGTPLGAAVLEAA